MQSKERLQHNPEQKSNFKKVGPFETISTIDQQLRSDLAEGKEAPPATLLHGLIDYALSSASRISHIEDRQEVRYMLRYWGSFLARNHHEEFPDTDFDRPDRQPKELTSRPILDHSNEGKRHGGIEPKNHPTKTPPYK